jgi:hypothetical protein
VADHPVKAPPELFTEWFNEALRHTSLNAKPGTVAAVMADRAAQWGADQELEACIDVLGSQSAWDVLAECTGWKEFRDESEDILRAARRPKPPSLAEQGLKALGPSVGLKHFRMLSVAEQDDIRAALNRLKELEAQQ